MALSKTRPQAVDLDDIEREIREIARKSSDDQLVAELAQMVGRNTGGVHVGPLRAGPLQASDRDKRNYQAPDDGSAQVSVVSAEQALDDVVEPRPDDACAAATIPGNRVRRQSRALGLAVPILLVTVGVGVAVAMRVAPTDGVGSEPPVIKAEDATAQEARVTDPDLQMPAQSAIGATGSQIDVVGTTTPAPLDAAVPSPSAMPTVAANEPVPDAPQSAAISSMFGTQHRVSTVSVKPDLAPASKGEPEVAPLPPTRPKTLASTDATTVRAGHTTPMASHPRQRGKGGAH
jgi:hypothetical protein